MKIKAPVSKNDDLFIVAHTISDDIEKQLHSYLSNVLERYNHPKLISPLFTCIKELLMNAVKANYKNIFFENYSPKNNSQVLIEYETALKLFKLEMGRGDLNYLKKLAKKWKMYAKVEISITDDTLYAIITNPIAMTQIEMKKIKQKLMDAKECEDMVQYFNKVDDDPEKEGAGLGLILISMILKSLDVSQNNLKIESLKNSTIATLQIPLNKEFQIMENL